MSNPQPNLKEDESLGVEQLPQDELSASPGDEEIQASYLDVEAAGVATTSADSTEQPETESQPSQTVE
ncbi:hypothetical protein [Leptolyngbya sp. FACHB-17]|uniref:hypothetical protein n=1 Tax=unclassified Leptolyngbya TaxID=2650499 RepID=UPI001681593E|nr:hypothetical protein [Leptolyngbya sp. FACHB-17]MBD2080392.1 hypothetical protein [Leptolyngbya sp. FACHB-17]